MIEVIPIAVTTVNWPIYQALTTKLLHRSVLAGLDRKNITDRNLKGFIASLGEFARAHADPTATLRSPGVLAGHATVSFLVVLPREVIVQAALVGDLTITESDDSSATLSVAIVSATLQQWAVSILNGTAPDTNSETRSFYAKAMERLVEMDLGQLFADYTRRYQPDGSFALIKK